MSTPSPATALWDEPAVLAVLEAPALAGSLSDDELTATRLAELTAWAASLARSA